MAQALDDGQRKVGRRNLEGKALADESRELGLVLERVDARDRRRRRCDRAGTPAGPVRAIRQRHQRVDVAQVVADRLEIEALAVGLAAPVQVQRVDREAAGHNCSAAHV